MNCLIAFFLFLPITLQAQWRPVKVSSTTDTKSIQENFRRASIWANRKLDRFSNDTLYGQPIFKNGIKFDDGSIQTTAVLSSGSFSLADKASLSLTNTFVSSQTFQNSNFSFGTSTLVVTGGNVGIGFANPPWKLSVSDIGAGTLSTPTDIKFWPSITAGNPILYFHGFNPTAGVIQSGRLESKYFTGVGNNNITLGSASGSNIRLQVDSPTDGTHIGFNIGGTPNSAITAMLDGANGNGSIHIRNSTMQADAGNSTGQASLTMGTGLTIATGVGGIDMNPAIGPVTVNSTLTVSGFIGSGSLSAPTDIKFWPSITAGNPLLYFHGFNPTAGVIQSGSLQSEYFAGVPYNNVTLKSAVGANIRLQVGSPDSNTHIGFNIGGTPNSAVAAMLDGPAGNGSVHIRNSTMQADAGNSTGQASLTMGTNLTIATLTGGINMSPTTSFSVGTSTLVVTNGNVGIGTTVPDIKLHVSGSGPVISRIQSTNSYAQLNIQGGATGDVNWGILSGYPDAGNFTIREAGVANYVTILKTTGRMGIGTDAIANAPQNMLHIWKNQNARTSLIIQNNTQGTGSHVGLSMYSDQGGFDFLVYSTKSVTTLGGFPTQNSAYLRTLTSNPVDRLIFATGSAAPIYFSPNDTQSLSLLANGNIGIGTLVPSTKLTLSSGIFTNDGLASGIVTNSSVTATLGFIGPGTSITGIPQLSATQIFTGANTFSGTITTGSSVTVIGGISSQSPTQATAPDFSVDTTNGAGGVPHAEVIVGRLSATSADHTTFRVRDRNDGTILYINPGVYGAYVGVNTSAPASALDVTGQIRQSDTKSCTLGLKSDANGTITGCVSSSEKLKKNILPYFTAVDNFPLLNPVTFNWKSTSTYSGDNRSHIGFIAEEVEKIYPQAVSAAGEGILGIDAVAMTAILTKKLQQLEKRIEELEKK